jgi:hypothetical protein
MTHPELLHMAATQEVEARHAAVNLAAMADRDVVGHDRRPRRHRGRDRQRVTTPRWLFVVRRRSRVGAFPPATEHVDITTVVRELGVCGSER